MKSCSRFWELNACYFCINEEQDEFENNRPLCKNKGICKYLTNEDAKKAGLSYAPPLLLDACGLREYDDTVQAIAWQELDEAGLPTFRALSYFDLEGPFETREFLELYGKWLAEEREKIARTRRRK